MSMERAARNRRRNRMSMLGIGMVVVVLLATLLILGNDLDHQLAYYESQEAALNAKIEDETQRTQEIEELRDYMTTDEYAEEVAREKLGLVKDNEIVFQEIE